MSTAPPGPPPDLQAAPPAAASIASRVRHHLIFRDTVTFLTLTACTVLLFSTTLLLFRSFAAHQQQLARRWSERGRVDLAQGHPDQAVASLRTALTYAPGERSYELLLAQALGDAGHTEESYTYFTGLWDRTPGDGLINLRLARLAAIKGDREDAINFYRASIYGTWPGDAIVRRQQTRLELAEYLIAQKQFAPAREELLIAGSNAGHNPELDRRLSGLLVSANDPHDALDYELKALADRPTDADGAAAAARLSDTLGDFPQALHLTDRALHLLIAAHPEAAHPTETLAQMRTLRSELERLQALDPAETLPAAERAGRILANIAIARQRLTTCLAGTGSTPSTPPASLVALSNQWTALQPTLNPRTLPRNHDAQDAAAHLVDSTELLTTEVCGTPTGDDALLLRLARQHTEGSTATPSQTETATPKE